MTLVASGSARVRVPATSANLGPGYDALGLALALYDDVRVDVVADGVHVIARGEGAEQIPRDGSHLIVRAMQATFTVLGATVTGLALDCTNRIPHGRGLGSSAAAICAGVLLARCLVTDGSARLDDGGVLDLAARIEGHPDNVAACLLGGVTIAWRDSTDVTATLPPNSALHLSASLSPTHSGAERCKAAAGAAAGATAGADDDSGSASGRFRAVRIEPGAQLSPVVFIPPFESSTEVARRLLPGAVPHRDAAFNAARAALLVAAISADLSALLPATEDRLHQDYRAPAMPASAELMTRLRRVGVAAVVSGAGPTVLALASSREQAGRLELQAPTGWVAHCLAVDRGGAKVSTG